MSGSVTQCLDCKSNVWAGTKVCPNCGSNNIAITLREASKFYSDKLKWHCNYCPNIFPHFKALVEHYEEFHTDKLNTYHIKNSKGGYQGIVKATSELEVARFFNADINDCKIKKIEGN